MKATLLFIEAVAAAAPCMLIAVGGVPILAFSGFSMLSYEPINALMNILAALGICLALVQYGSLAFRTVQAQRFRFGLPFWLAVPSALLAIKATFGGLFTVGQAIAVALPVSLATAHFIVLQILWRSRWTKAEAAS